MKRLLILFITLLCLTGCMPKTEDKPIENKTIETVFVEGIKNNEDINTVAQSIVQNLNYAFKMDVMNVNPGYLPGFVQDITAFDEGVLISPIVGTIPFVCYIFYTEKPELLMEALENYYDMRWNICTEAEVKIAAQQGNYVLFAMMPAESEK